MVRYHNSINGFLAGYQLRKGVNNRNPVRQLTDVEQKRMDRHHVVVTNSIE